MAEIRINATGELKLYDSDDSNYVSFKSGGTVSSNVTWTLPTADGSSGQALTTDGSGTLSWATASSADPSSADGDTLGTASAEWSDLYLADGGIVYFGNDQDIRLTHNADKGLILKHSATADDKPVILTLQTGETDMAADDVIGKIEFQAPDEGTGTDAVLVSGAIQAVAEGDHSSSSNATRLEFMTGASEAAATKMWLTSGGKLGLGTAPDLGTLHVRTADSSGGVSADADELVLENSGHAGLTIASGNSSNGNIYFSDDGNSAIGYLQYGHDNNDLTIATNDANAMVIDGNGIITMPKQSCFQAVVNPSADQANVALGSFVDIEFDNERFDLNADFNTTNYTFTAPVTGKYNFNIMVRFDNVDSAHTWLTIRFTTSNRNYDSLIHNPDHDLGSDGTISLGGSYLVDMDASDTAKVTVEITSGTAQTDINGGNSYFMGYLVA